MPRAHFFAKLGLFVIHNFFNAETCTQICSEMHGTLGEPASITLGQHYFVDTNARFVDQVKIPEKTYAMVNTRLLAVIPVIANHFGLILTKAETPQFLRYRRGNFFRLHKDNNREGTLENVQARRVSVVIFLNDEIETPQAQTEKGGALTLYGLINKQGWDTKGFSLCGESGLLLAFPSDVLHEVKPVEQDERFTIVTWLS